MIFPFYIHALISLTCFVFGAFAGRWLVNRLKNTPMEGGKFAGPGQRAEHSRSRQ